MIKKYELLIFLVFALSVVGCHSQRETVSFEIDKDINDNLPLKVTVEDKSELNDSVNVEIFVLKDIIIRSTYSYPIYLAHIRNDDNDNDSTPEDCLSPTVFSIDEPDKIGSLFYLNKNILANDSIHIKFALDFNRRIAIKDKDALIQNAKLSQILYGYKIYDIGKFSSFKDFIYTHIPPCKYGHIVIFVNKDREHEQPYIAVLRVPMDP